MRFEKPEVGSVYHVVNRGVEKRDIFLNEDDYTRFIISMDIFNKKNNISVRDYLKCHDDYSIGMPGKWIFKDLHCVKIHAFCLMENHFHLLLEPLVENGLEIFMHKIGTGYTRYFNLMYKRVGALFGSHYEYTRIDSDEYYSRAKRYVHLNALDYSMPEWREGLIKDPKAAIDKAASYPWSDLKQSLTSEYKEFLMNSF